MDPTVTIHFGTQVPPCLQSETGRPWAAHNAWSFDQLVWKGLHPECLPVSWIDTYPLSLASGLPGGLGNIGERLWGEGKYEEGGGLIKKWTKKDKGEVPLGPLLVIGKYNVQDVKLLRSLWGELCKTLKLPDWEWDVLETHRKINDRGVKIDRKLLRDLILLSDQCKHRAIEKISELTSGFLSTQKDLRCRTKIFKWLELNNANVGKSLRKEIVKQYIDEQIEEAGIEEEELTKDTPGPGLPTVIKVLELRSSALRITDAKLVSAMQSIDDNDIARGLYVYWGAGPGRWAGRRIQIQNLPRPKKGVDVWGIMDGPIDFDRIKGMLDYSADRLLTPDDAASALIRSLFMGPMYAADFASIEARMLAWLAGDKKSLEVYWNDEDPYIKAAEILYGIPWQKWPGLGKVKKHPWRQVGKVMILGCIAEGSPVLTDSGWRPIEQVQLTDKVWDGENFVTHKGVVFSGVKSCLQVNGVRLTGDHRVWTDDGWVKAEDLPIRNFLSGQYGVDGRLYPERLSVEVRQETLWPDGMSLNYGLIELTLTGTTNPVTLDSQLLSSRVGTLEKTYDILGVGSRSCFQCGPMLVHNCGYQCGPAKLAIFAAGQGVDFVEAGTDPYTVVETWRTNTPDVAGEIVGEYKGRPYRRGGLWWNLNQAALRCVQDGTEETVGKIQFHRDSGHMYIRLPSGRHICYRDARVEATTPRYLVGSGKTVDSVVYTHPRYGRKNPIFGGLLAENCTQGACRDMMAHALCRLEDNDFQPTIHVHDEGAGYKEDSFPLFMSCMTTLPPWAPDFPLDAEGGPLPRYAKSAPPGVKEEVWRNGAFLKFVE